MPPTIRCSASLTSTFLSTTRRQTLLDLSRAPGLRPLHASPIFQRPRHRDFFSTNKTLSVQRTTETQSKPSPHDESNVDAVRKRKAAGSPAAKTSLRRVAVEAQRTKDGKLAKTQRQPDETPRLVTAYAVAERFDLARVIDILRSKGYEPDPLDTGLYPQVVHIQVPISSIYRSTNPSAKNLSSAEVGDIFIFPSGTLVTWALPEGFTSYFATRTLLPAAEQPHKEPIEMEDLEYIEDPHRETSTIKGDTIILGTRQPHQNIEEQDSAPSEDTTFQTQTVDTALTKVAFSSGFARSTKLAILETALEKYLASTSTIPFLLSKGSRLPLAISRRFILRKTGELLLLRAQLNLYSELTDSLPDLFWDSRHDLHLESYYDQVGKALDVGIRIKLLNEKMDYAGEIAQVLRERLSEKHGLFLEWTIIILIAIEVAFGIIHLQRDGYWQELLGNDTGSSSSSSDGKEKHSSRFGRRDRMLEEKSL